ncbi:hypothetical protein GY656_26120, partial [Escherichia coli]|uniref:hypothetical protein n=1 Tax=Escherichia coli TaxID=562 RepID=UPI0015BE64AD
MGAVSVASVDAERGSGLAVLDRGAAAETVAGRLTDARRRRAGRLVRRLSSQTTTLALAAAGADLARIGVADHALPGLQLANLSHR